VHDAGETIESAKSNTQTSYWLELSGDGLPDQRVYLSCTEAASFL
jgi:hypothetical protein